MIYAVEVENMEDINRLQSTAGRSWKQLNYIIKCNCAERKSRMMMLIGNKYADTVCGLSK